MNTQEKTYTKEQNLLIAEFCAVYGLEPSQIIFFNDDPKPFFDREATAVLLHKLTPAVGIEDDLVASPVGDAISVKYRITFEDGSFAGSTGTANLGEKNNGQAMTPEQIKSLATSRAARGALVNKGLDLVKLHYAGRESSVAEYSGPPKSRHETLLRQVHALGVEAGLIDKHAESGDGKLLWYQQLRIRYGVERSSNLGIAQLEDFAAFLNALKPAAANEAAA